MMFQVHGGDIYNYPNMLDFSANINPLGMPKRVYEAAKLGIHDSVHYPEVLSSKLRNVMAEHFHIKQEYIICGNGAAELIFTICFARKPQKALLIAPGFAEYEAALKSVSCEIVYHDLKEEENFLLTKEYEACLTENLDIVFLCNPNNPTGTLIEKEYLLEILELCKQKDILMVLDECFIDFLDNPEDFSLRSAINQYENLFLLNAFTKLYAMPGLRLGYGFCKNVKLLAKMQSLLQPWNVSLPAQYAGIAALQEVDYVKKSREVIKEEKIILMEQLECCLAKKIYGSKVNYIFFRGDPKLTDLFIEEGILIRDCSNYHGLSKGFFRIAVRNRRENECFITAMKHVSLKLMDPKKLEGIMRL